MVYDMKKKRVVKKVASVEKVEQKPKFTEIEIYNEKHKIRTYSLDVHGKLFVDLASEFLSKHKDYIIVTR